MYGEGARYNNVRRGRAPNESRVRGSNGDRGRGRVCTRNGRGHRDDRDFLYYLHILAFKKNFKYIYKL